MGKPDALSHRSDHGASADDNSNVVLLTPKLFAVRALEGLQFIGPEQDILQDIQQGTKQPKEEPVTRAAQELRKSSTRSLRSTEWLEHNGLLYYRRCIYVPDTSDLRHRIVSLCHDTKVAGHPGRFNTLELVSQSYWWPNMSRYVGMYVSHCALCLHIKIQHRLPTGELQPLPIPEERWDVISVDFISELLESGGYDSIMVAINSTGKHSHFVETVTTVTAARAANLYLWNIWKLHGLLWKVVSDCGPQFVATFMKELLSHTMILSSFSLFHDLFPCLSLFYGHLLYQCSCSLFHCSLFYCPLFLVPLSMFHCSLFHCPLFHCSLSIVPLSIVHCSYHCSLFYCSYHCSFVPLFLVHCPLFHCSSYHCSLHVYIARYL